MSFAMVFNLSAIALPILSIMSLRSGSSTAAITLLTFTYHIWMRMIAGMAVSLMRIDGKSRVFQVGKKEILFYERIGIRRWKDHLPTYNPKLFRERDMGKLYSSMLHAEAVHAVIAVLSYIPFIVSLLSGYLRSSWCVFLLTSAAASCIDLLFVAAQRYNSPRVKRILEHHMREAK